MTKGWWYWTPHRTIYMLQKYRILFVSSSRHKILTYITVSRIFPCVLLMLLNQCLKALMCKVFLPQSWKICQFEQVFHCICFVFCCGNDTMIVMGCYEKYWCWQWKFIIFPFLLSPKACFTATRHWYSRAKREQNPQKTFSQHYRLFNSYKEQYNIKQINNMRWPYERTMAQNFTVLQR